MNKLLNNGQVDSAAEHLQQARFGLREALAQRPVAQCTIIPEIVVPVCRESLTDGATIRRANIKSVDIASAWP
jgi:hypothetical protein